MGTRFAIIDWEHQGLLTGQAIDLSRAQIDVLYVLATQGSGQALGVDDLAERVFGISNDHGEANNIRFHISGLRKKIEGSGIGVRTRQGVGYELRVDQGMSIRTQRLSL